MFDDCGRRRGDWHVRYAHSRLWCLGQYVLELAFCEFFLQKYPRELGWLVGDVSWRSAVEWQLGEVSWRWAIEWQLVEVLWRWVEVMQHNEESQFVGGMVSEGALVKNN